MSKQDYNNDQTPLDENLSSRQAAIYDQLEAIRNPEYAASIINEDGKLLNEPYLTPGDISRKLNCERNRMRKMITETFRDCLCDIVERDTDDPDDSLGRQSRAKTLLSARDLEIMKQILNYKERGFHDKEIKLAIENLKNSTAATQEAPEGRALSLTDPAILNVMRELVKQTYAASNGIHLQQLQETVDPLKQALDNIGTSFETRIDAAIQDSIEKNVENQRLKDELDRKDAEIERLKKETEERIAELEADLEDARNKKRPWFKPWW